MPAEAVELLESSHLLPEWKVFYWGERGLETEHRGKGLIA